MIVCSLLAPCVPHSIRRPTYSSEVVVNFSTLCTTVPLMRLPRERGGYAKKSENSGAIVVFTKESWAVCEFKGKKNE